MEQVAEGASTSPGEDPRHTPGLGPGRGQLSSCVCFHRLHFAWFSWPMVFVEAATEGAVSGPFLGCGVHGQHFT